MIIPIHKINDKNELVVLKEAEISFKPKDSYTYAKMLNEIFNTQELKEEHGFVIAIDKKFNPIGILENKGESHSVEINYMEIVLYLKLTNAYSFVTAHNHPNGIASPSRADLDIVMELLTLFPKELIDAIIIGGYGDDYVYSFHDERFFEHKNDMVDWFHTRNNLRLENEIIQLKIDKFELEERLSNLEKVLIRNGIIDIKKLTALPNISKKLAEKMLNAGIYNKEILDDKGSKDAWLTIRSSCERVTKKELFALEGAIQGVRSTDLSSETTSDLEVFLKKHQ